MNSHSGTDPTRKNPFVEPWLLNGQEGTRRSILWNAASEEREEEEEESPETDKDDDDVDQASEDSFPASDPPAWT